MKTQFKWPIAPHPISALDLDVIAGQRFFVGDGTTWTPAEWKDGAWHAVAHRHPQRDQPLAPQPTHFLTPTIEDPVPGAAEARAGWNCGNGALGSRYVLLLVERNPGMSVEQMDAIADLIDRAGPTFAQARVDFYTNDEVPF